MAKQTLIKCNCCQQAHTNAQWVKRSNEHGPTGSLLVALLSQSDTEYYVCPSCSAEVTIADLTLVK